MTNPWRPQSLAEVVVVMMTLTVLGQFRGMRTCLLIIPLVLALSACNTPSPPFRGATPTRVSVAGATYDVRVRGLQAEAMRINPQYAPRFGPLRAYAATAMQRVSGCQVASISGDQALAFGRLDCGDGPPPVRPQPVDVECDPVRGSEIEELGQVRIELDCAPSYGTDMEYIVGNFANNPSP